MQRATSWPFARMYSHILRDPSAATNALVVLSLTMTATTSSSRTCRAVGVLAAHS